MEHANQFWSHGPIKACHHADLRLKHRLTKERSWIDGLFNPAWVTEEFTSRALAQAQDRNSAIAISSFVGALRDCARNKDLRRGARIHNDILKSGLLGKCSDALLCMYAKCGVLLKAKQLLDVHKSRNVCTWNALISGYVQMGQPQAALTHFEQMQAEGLHPDAVTFSCILKACASLQASNKGEKIHNQIARQGLLQSNVILGTALVDMYAKCGALTKAQRVLEELPARNIFSWSAMIAGYAQHGKGREALACFRWMQREGLSADAVTFTSILKACGSIGAINEGEWIHDLIARQGLLRGDVVLGTALVDMYAKCGALLKARQMLDEISVRNVCSWNALIAGYTQYSEWGEALQCFEQMQREGFSPTVATYSCIAKACGSMCLIDKGEHIHEEVSKQGLLEKSIVLGNSIIDMYTRCNALEKAWQVLERLPIRNVVSWSTLIAGYAQQRRVEEALRCFEQMKCEGLSPNAVTFICLLGMCSGIGVADMGETIHYEIAKQKLLEKDIVLGNALVNMYAKCGDLARAQQVLAELPVRNVISWNALIAGYAQHDEGEQALACYEKMQCEGLSPNVVTFISILKACGGVGAADKGKQIHEEISKEGLLAGNIALGTALVSMYAKCGALSKAWEVLKVLPFRNVISWNALMTGSVQNGECEQALSCFEQLQCEGFSPDTATFSCLLSAFSRLGLEKEAQAYFLEMSPKYGIKPDLEHYSSLIDIFCRTGHLNKAAGIMGKMPSSCTEGWSTLLGACQKWGGIGLGRLAFEHALQ